MSNKIEFVLTEDGSPTAYFDDFSQEKMHHSGGALGETIYIYGPAIQWGFSKIESPMVYSIGTGLAYNEILSAAFSILFEQEFFLTSFEKNEALNTSLREWVLSYEGGSAKSDIGFSSQQNLYSNSKNSHKNFHKRSLKDSHEGSYENSHKGSHRGSYGNFDKGEDPTHTDGINAREKQMGSDNDNNNESKKESENEKNKIPFEIYDLILSQTAKVFEIPKEEIHKKLYHMLKDGKWEILGALSEDLNKLKSSRDTLLKWNTNTRVNPNVILFDLFSAKSMEVFWREDYLAEFFKICLSNNNKINDNKISFAKANSDRTHGAEGDRGNDPYSEADSNDTPYADADDTKVARIKANEKEAYGGKIYSAETYGTKAYGSKAEQEHFAPVKKTSLKSKNTKLNSQYCAFASYACTGALKRALKANGFYFVKRKGYLWKRDSSFAMKIPGDLP